MMAHVPLLQKAQDLSVFIVGNIDIDYFLNILNLNINLGGLTTDGEPLEKLEIPFVSIDGEPFIIENPNMTGTAIIARAFYVPNVQEYSEQVKTSLASEIYSKILYNVVREKYGACYAPMSYILGGYSNVGLEVLFSVSDFENFADYMEEARQIMKKGLYIQNINSDGSFEFVPMQDKLQGFKNSFINSTFINQKTTEGIAHSLANNYLLSKDFSNANLIEIIETITAEDIIATFEKYWLQDKSQWFVVAGKNEAQKIEKTLN
jgi:zinc protease